MITAICQRMSILTPSVYWYDLALSVTQSAFAARKRRSRESKITRCSHNSTTLLLPVWTKATETYDLESTPGRHTLTKLHVCMHYLSLLHLLISWKHFSPQNTAMLSLWHNPHSQNVKKTLFPQQLGDVFCSFWTIRCLRLPPGE